MRAQCLLHLKRTDHDTLGNTTTRPCAIMHNLVFAFCVSCVYTCFYSVLSHGLFLTCPARSHVPASSVSRRRVLAPVFFTCTRVHSLLVYVSSLVYLCRRSSFPCIYLGGLVFFLP
jgi:hypothetical protein